MGSPISLEVRLSDQELCHQDEVWSLLQTSSSLGGPKNGPHAWWQMRYVRQIHRNFGAKRMPFCKLIAFKKLCIKELQIMYVNLPLFKIFPVKAEWSLNAFVFWIFFSPVHTLIEPTEFKTRKSLKRFSPFLFSTWSWRRMRRATHTFASRKSYFSSSESQIRSSLTRKSWQR